MPDGFVDTGIRCTVGASGSVSLKGFGFNGPDSWWDGDQTNAELLDFQFRGRHSMAEPPSSRATWHVSNMPAGILLQEIGSQDFQGEQNAPTSPFYHCQRTTGPFRLGARYSVPQDWGWGNPPYLGVKHYLMDYQWFADGDTMVTWECSAATPGSVTKRYLEVGPGAGPPFPDPELPVSVGRVIGYVEWSAWIPYQAEVYAWTDTVRFRDLAAGEVVGTSELTPAKSAWIMQGSGGGSVDCTAYAQIWPDLGKGNWQSAAPPWQFRYDGRVTRFGEDAPDWARLVDGWLTVRVNDAQGNPKPPYSEYITFPAANGLYEVANVSWETTCKQTWPGVTFALQSAWAQAQDPSLPAEDAYVPIRAAPPLRVGGGGRQSYQPVTVQLAPEVKVHRPDGNRPSDWVSSDAASLVVTESAQTTAIQVLAPSPGLNASRTLNTSWRSWIGSNPINIRRLKHEAGDDVWWWGTYAFLRIGISAPAASTLTLRLDWVHVPAAGSEAPGSATYTLTLAAGANTIDLDLLFPDGGGPVYPGRIEKLTLGGFAEGVYTITAMKLAANSDGYLKVGFGVPRAGGDYSVPVLAVDGSFAFGNVPDQANKQDETGQYGGSPRYLDPGAGAQKTIAAFWGELDQIEGLSAAYDPDAYDAANRDSTTDPDDPNYPGTALGPENADWTHPIVAYDRLSPGQDWKPECSPTCRHVGITNMHVYHCWFDHSVWGGMEILANTAESTRAPAGRRVYAFRTDTHQVVATAVTDASGYAVLHPIPANEHLGIALAVG